MTDSIDLDEALAEGKRLQDERLKSYTDAFSRAYAAKAAGRINEAEGICHDVIETYPNTAPEALAMLGQIASIRKRPRTAVDWLEQAIALDANTAQWHIDLCDQLYQLGDFKRGIECAEYACGLEQSSDAYIRLATGYAASTTGDERVEKVRHTLLRALALNPDHAHARMWLGELLIAKGEFESGWREWQSRLQYAPVVENMPRFKSAHWSGMNIPDGKILVCFEGGYGDMIQFSRFLPMVRERCSGVILLCPADIAPILSHACTDMDIISDTLAIPAHAANVSMLSLGYIFNAGWSTIAGTLPTNIHITEDARIRAKAYVEALSGRTVGVCWAGRETHKRNGDRSMPLFRLDPLLKLPDATLVCLQVPIPEKDRSDFGMWMSEGRIVVPPLQDWNDTAAMIAELDMVITVDTAVAHLAGSLRKKTALMLPDGSDWRWMLGRTYTPWYESMTIHRQPQQGNWRAVVEQVMKDYMGGRPINPAEDMNKLEAEVLQEIRKLNQ